MVGRDRPIREGVVFYEVCGKQGTQFYDGEWNPYPRDFWKLYAEPGAPPEGLRVVVRRGVRPGDAVFATPNVVSSRFVDVLRDSGVRNFETFPVPLVKDERQVALFYGLKVYGRGGPFDPFRSNADMREGGVCFRYSSIYMDESQWDGSDMFLIRGLGVAVFVTKKVAKAIREARLLNVRLTVNTECHLP